MKRVLFVIALLCPLLDGVGGDDGHMEFHRDHYERDAAIAAAMK